MRGKSKIKTDRNLNFYLSIRTDPWLSQRRLGALGKKGKEFVHVPQLAENRFS